MRSILGLFLLSTTTYGAGLPACRIRDAVFPTDTAIYLLCEQGYVLATGDAGKTWATHQTNATEKLVALAFFDPLRGLIAGGQGLVLATEDGGKSWQKRATGVNDQLTSIRVVGESAWITGHAGVILNSADARHTWTRQTTNVTQPLERLYFADALHGWAVGWVGTMLRTSDGGKNWELIKSPAAQWSLNSVYFRDDKNGWAVGFAGQILRSRDGGATWAVQESPVRSWLMSILFETPNRGWIASDDGFLVSEDGGETWKPVTFENRPFLFRLVQGKSSLWAISPFGLLTRSGGAWKKFEGFAPSAAPSNEAPKAPAGPTAP